MAMAAVDEVVLAEGECWWGGAVADGQRMPFGPAVHRRNLATSAGFLTNDQDGANQSAPLLVSNRGRYIWSEDAFTFEFVDSTLRVTGGNPVVGAGRPPTLAGAFRMASRAHFPPSGATPAAAMFASPQYNTWIEMPYRPTQARSTRLCAGAAGFRVAARRADDRRPLVPAYGTWQFDPVTLSRTRPPWSSTLHSWGSP